MCKKLIYLVTLALAASVFAATYPGHLGVNISLPERCGTFTNQTKDNWRYTDVSGNDLTSGQVDSQGWPSIDCQYIVDWRPVAEWSGTIDDPAVYRCNMSGTYKCSFTGQATLTWIQGDFVIQNQVYNSGTNTTTFDIVVSAPAANHGVMILKFTNTKRTSSSATNTGFTNLKIMYPGYAIDTTQVFTTAFLNCLTIADFSTIRFMDFRSTNDSEPTYPATTAWSQRKLTTDASQNPIPQIGKLDGGAWEYVIQIGNAAMMDIWINVQLSATDDYVTQLATLIKNNLDPNLNVYVESSNEVWNSIFGQYNYNEAQATALGLTDLQNHARRTVRLAQIFESVFGAGSLNNRVRVMLCTHAPMLKWWLDDGTTNTMLPYINANYGPPKNYIYGIACQTYFGGTGANGGGTYTVAQLLTNAHNDITSQINDTGSNAAGRMQWIAKAAAWQLVGGFCSYEGGPDYGGGDTTNIANRILCNRDSGMATQFKYNLDDAFFALGGNLAMQFSLTSGYNRYGCWGLTDDVTNPDRNYKFQAARDLIGTPTPPGQATNPSPANGATGVSTTAILSWTAGSGATSHDVYFGTVSPGTSKGNQTGTTYNPGTLANSTTYYWRIDEKNSAGTTTGVVWSFTTAAALPPGQATNPSPANGATSVSTTADLSWTAGSGATSHDVYFGTVSPGTFIGNQTGTTYDTGTMANNTTYYWRIDEKNANGTTTGVVWSFTTIAAGTTPTFVAAGAVASGTGAITPALPSGIAVNDILLLFLETANQAISISNQNGGTWAAVTNSPQGTGTAASSSATRLTVFWSRYNGTQGAPTASDSGNHQLGRIIAVRGAITSGNPWDVTAGGVEATADTSGAIPGATTTVGNTFVVAAIATALPDATGTANFSAWANSNLTSVTERTDNTVTAGNGGGLGVATGVKATAGAYGNTTVTVGTSSRKGMMSIAVKGG